MSIAAIPSNNSFYHNVRTNLTPSKIALGAVVSWGAYQAYQNQELIYNSLNMWGVAGVGLTFFIVTSVKKYCKNPVVNPNRSVFNNMGEARKSGLKIAIFLGRQNDQSTPVEKGYTWFSLDQEVNPEADTTHHIQIDFNDPEKMQEIPLADKIVVDVSVIKFFKVSPWDCLAQRLVKNADSELIVESWKHMGSIVDKPHVQIDPQNATLIKTIGSELRYLQAIDDTFETCAKGERGQEVNTKFSSKVQEESRDGAFELDKQEIRQIKLEILEELDALPEREGLQALLEGIHQYLFTLFNNVERVKGPYPYLDHSHQVEYWVARHPKG